MKFRLTKTSKIIFGISIGVLSLALAFLIWRVNQEESTAPEDAEASICGEPPTASQLAPYTIHKPPTSINIPQDGTIVLYFTSLLSDTYRPKFRFSLNGTSYPSELKIPALSSKRVRYVTEMNVSAGDTLTLLYSDDDWTQTGTCEELLDPKYRSFGWIAVSNGKCGTTLPGPPSQYIPFVPVDVSSSITWADNTDDLILSRQCWADWREWVGDYDFNDYFLQIGLKVAAPQENLCDGGSWTNRPTGNIAYETDIGFSAKAQDSDGIEENSISAKLCEGTLTKCSTGRTINHNVTNKTATSTTFSGVLSNSTSRLDSGDYTLTVSWDDALGATGSACTLTTTFAVLPEETNPDWDITKSVVEQCIDDNTENPVSQLTYTITVDNTGDGAGEITSIEDVLDGKVLAAGLVPNEITSPGEYSTGEILWDFSASPLSIPSGSSRAFTYSLDVGKDDFGIYNNTVTLSPVGSADIQASATIEADCNIVEPDEPEPEPDEPEPEPDGPVPETGILDSTIGRIAVGGMLLLLGVVVYNIPSGIFLIKGKEQNFKYRDRFEKKVDKK